MGGDLSLQEHMEELRRRLIVVLLVLSFFSVLAYPVTDDVVVRVEDYVLTDYSSNVIVTTPLEAVVVRLELSVLLGVFFSAPLVFYEFFRFMAPGLRPRERKCLVLASAGSFLLFVAGAAFTYLLLPFMMGFLLDFAAPMAQPMLVLGEFMSFVMLLVFSMGLVFQWPLVAGVLAYLGVVSPGALGRWRRYAFVLCFVFAAAVTPDPSVVLQVFVAVPMVLLYEAGIFAAGIVGGKTR